jgi:hypothetical protein
MKRYIWNILIALDQLANTILFGDPDETISSRAAKGQHKWYWYRLGNFLELIDKGHLVKSKEDDEGKDSVFK